MSRPTTELSPCSASPNRLPAAEVARLVRLARLGVSMPWQIDSQSRAVHPITGCSERPRLCLSVVRIRCLVLVASALARAYAPVGRPAIPTSLGGWGRLGLLDHCPASRRLGDGRTMQPMTEPPTAKLMNDPG